MAGSLTLTSWPTTTGFDGSAYFDHFLEQMQIGMPGGVPGVLPYSSDQVLGAYSNEFKVFADSTGMQVKVYQGRCYCKGVFAKIPDASVSGGVYTLTVTAAHATLYRIDTVIIRYDLTTGSATLRMLDGTAAVVTSAAPTTLTQSATTWEIPLAYVMVDPAVSTIAAKDTCDIRPFAATNAEILRLMGFANPIVNGGMEVWNDGTSFSSIASGTFGPEMYAYLKAGAVVHDLLQSADVPAVATNVQKDNYSLHLDVTTADASIAAGDYSAIEHRVEGRLAKRVLQRGFTLPFWVKDTITGWHAVAFLNSGNDRSFVAEYFVSAADTWELKFAHVPASPTAGTWDYTSGTGLRVVWPQACGSTFQTTTPGAWTTGQFYGTARTVNSNSSTANNFKLWGVGNMVPGNLVVPFSPPNDEEILTRRYYRVYGGGDANEVIGVGQCTANNIARVDLLLDPPMRGAPAGSVSAASDWAAANSTGSLQAGSSAAFALGTTRSIAFALTVAGTPLVAGDASRITANGTTNARMKLNARLS